MFITLCGFSGFQEVPHSDVQILELVGKGAFGEVRKATLYGSEVAVKAVKIYRAPSAKRLALRDQPPRKYPPSQRGSTDGLIFCER